MSPFTVLGWLITLAALASYANHRFIGLPHTAALMLLSSLLSLGMIAGSFIGLPFKDFLEDLLRQVDFSQSLPGGVLSFLLFAGALNIDLADLREHRWQVFSLGFVTTLISVGLAAGATFFVFGWLGLPIPLLYCLLFGAIISPTDPIAVLGLLRRRTPRLPCGSRSAGISPQRWGGCGRLPLLDNFLSYRILQKKIIYLFQLCKSSAKLMGRYFSTALTRPTFSSHMES